MVEAAVIVLVETGESDVVLLASTDVELLSGVDVVVAASEVEVVLDASGVVASVVLEDLVKSIGTEEEPVVVLGVSTTGDEVSLVYT